MLSERLRSNKWFLSAVKKRFVSVWSHPVLGKWIFVTTRMFIGGVVVGIGAEVGDAVYDGSSMTRGVVGLVLANGALVGATEGDKLVLVVVAVGTSEGEKVAVAVGVFEGDKVAVWTTCISFVSLANLASHVGLLLGAVNTSTLYILSAARGSSSSSITIRTVPALLLIGSIIVECTASSSLNVTLMARSSANPWTV